MPAHYWFPTCIYVEEMDSPMDVQSDMLSYFNKFGRNKSSLSIATGDNTGDYEIYKEPEFLWLNQEIFKHSCIYLESLGVDIETVKIYASKAWPVIMKKGSYVPKHRHQNATLSCVYYLQSDDNETGRLTLHASHSEMDFLPLKFTPNGSSYNKCFYPAVPGRLIIFPSTLNHEVEVYSGEKERYSLSYDLMVITKDSTNSNAEYVIHDPSKWIELQ